MQATQELEVPRAEAGKTIRHSVSGGYTLDNSAAEVAERFRALGEIFDPWTIQHLMELGVTEGWQCLEVGGGEGSIARWLCKRVSPAGRVVATDINTCFLDRLKFWNLEVRRHNIVTDPLPENTFDLVHARLVLMHLPEREAVLSRLIKALKPGGWLLDEEFDALSLPADPHINPSEVRLNSHFAMHRVMAERGVDPRFGRFLYGRLRAHGLEDVCARARLPMGAGGSTESKLIRSNCEQLRGPMIEGGHLTSEDLEYDLKRLDDPDCLFLTPTLWSAWGRRTRS